MPFVNDSLQEKYSRQILFAGIGPEGQERLLASRAAIIGCGAIGAAAANLLVSRRRRLPQNHRSRLR